MALLCEIGWGEEAFSVFGVPRLHWAEEIVGRQKKAPTRIGALG